MFKNIKELVDAEESGAVIYTTFRKLPGSSATVTVWQDLAMSPGYPSPIYYASNPMEAVALNYSTHGGIYHGGAVYPKQKILRKSLLMASTAGSGVMDANDIATAIWDALQSNHTDPGTMAKLIKDLETELKKKLNTSLFLAEN